MDFAILILLLALLILLTIKLLITIDFLIAIILVIIILRIFTTFFDINILNLFGLEMKEDKLLCNSLFKYIIEIANNCGFKDELDIFLKNVMINCCSFKDKLRDIISICILILIIPLTSYCFFGLYITYFNFLIAMYLGIFTRCIIYLITKIQRLVNYENEKIRKIKKLAPRLGLQSLEKYLSELSEDIKYSKFEIKILKNYSFKYLKYKKKVCKNICPILRKFIYNTLIKEISDKIIHKSFTDSVEIVTEIYNVSKEIKNELKSNNSLSDKIENIINLITNSKIIDLIIKYTPIENLINYKKIILELILDIKNHLKYFSSTIKSDIISSKKIKIIFSELFNFIVVKFEDIGVEYLKNFTESILLGFTSSTVAGSVANPLIKNLLDLIKEKLKKIIKSINDYFGIKILNKDICNQIIKINELNNKNNSNSNFINKLPEKNNFIELMNMMNKQNEQKSNFISNF